MAYQGIVVPVRVEWPTVAVAAAITVAFAALLASHQHLPIAVVVVLLALLSGWYGSLQHEVIHGHPTPWRAVNTAVASIPVGLAVRFGSYRDSHLAHHATTELTDPELDPESFYVTPARWAATGPCGRTLLVICSTLFGRLLLGPFLLAARQWRQDLTVASTPAGAVRVAGHLAGVVAVLLVVRATGLPLWAYVLGAGWGGLAVSLLRSYPEHLAVADGTRAAVVRSNLLGGLLFLNNNLHHTHHARPGLAWYRLPAVHDEIGGDAAAAAGAGLYRGYAEVAWCHLFRPFDDITRRPVGGP